MLPALYVIKWAKDSLGLDSVDLFGYSRGGATILNAIAILNDKTGEYDDELTRIGIDQQERRAILKMIQRGCIVLNCPLTDANVSAAFRFKNFAPKALQAFAKVGCYQPKGMQALASAQQLGKLKLKFLIHFQHHDTIVSNENEANLYHRLAYYNPRTTYIVLGNNGGHLHTHAALAHTVHTFKKIFGGSYNPGYDSQYHATKYEQIYENLLLQPGKKAEQIIADYYQLCKEKNQKQ